MVKKEICPSLSVFHLSHLLVSSAEEWREAGACEHPLLRGSCLGHPALAISHNTLRLSCSSIIVVSWLGTIVYLFGVWVLQA